MAVPAVQIRVRQGRAGLPNPPTPPWDVAWAAPAVGIPACGALITSLREETESEGKM